MNGPHELVKLNRFLPIVNCVTFLLNNKVIFYFEKFKLIFSSLETNNPLVGQSGFVQPQQEGGYYLPNFPLRDVLRRVTQSQKTYMLTLQSCKFFKCLFPILQLKQSSQSVDIYCLRKVFPLQK